MAQALARAGDDDLARPRYARDPRHARPARSPPGRGSSSTARAAILVLNAQLQSAVSLADYADLTGDTGGRRLRGRGCSRRRRRCCRASTPATGRATRSAPSRRSSTTTTSIDLLKTLGRATDDPIWTDTLKRFAALRDAAAGADRPERDAGRLPAAARTASATSSTVRFWLSKPSHVVLVVDGKAVDGLTGARRLAHVPLDAERASRRARTPCGSSRSSVDGHSGSADLPVVHGRARHDARPSSAAAKANGRVFWRAKDGESACCHLRLELRRGSEQHVARRSSEDEGRGRDPAAATGR